MLFLLLPLLLAMLLSGCSLLPARFNPAGEAPVEAQAPDQGAQAFTLEVQAPSELRELLELRPRVQVASVAAQVLYDATDPYSRRVVIDKGQLQGIQPGSPSMRCSRGALPGMTSHAARCWSSSSRMRVG